MTQQGLMSGKAQQFDKQDHKRLEQDWMTGFDNRDRLAHLTQQIHTQTQQWQTLDQAKKAAQAAQANAAAQHSLWQRLLTLRFEDLDVPAAQTLLQQLQGPLGNRQQANRPSRRHAARAGSAARPGTGSAPSSPEKTAGIRRSRGRTGPKPCAHGCRAGH
jgi:uncharacterized protein YPO0396